MTKDNSGKHPTPVNMVGNVNLGGLTIEEYKKAVAKLQNEPSDDFIDGFWRGAEFIAEMRNVKDMKK